MVLLGKGTVGKTSLINRFMNNMCPIEHDPTLEETYTIKISFEKGEEREFKILDTAGEEDYKNMIDEWIRSANGFILVFAINDEGSFESMKSYVQKINKNTQTKLPIILVGNKCDLEYDRKVTQENINEYAESIGSKYYETSALTDQNGNCKVIFQECANQIMKTINDDKKESRGEAKCVKCSIF